MAMREQQERRSPPLETTQPATDDLQQLMTGSGPVAPGSAAKSMATAGDMAGTGSGAAGQEELGAERAGLDVVRSPSSWAARLLSAAGSTYQVSVSSLIATPHFQRKPRTHVPRAAAPSPHWLGFKLPAVVVHPAAAPAKRKGGRAKKRWDMPCVLCGTAETPLWRTWPTDRRVALCNACGIQVRTLPPGAVVPELVYLPHPATATAAVCELEQPVAPAQEIQPVKNSPGAALPKLVRVNLPPPAMAATRVVPELEQPRQQEVQESEPESPPDSPILESMMDADIFLVKRTSPRRRENSPPPPPSPLPPPLTAEPEPAAGNENGKQPERSCLHCGATSTPQWRLGPAGERTLCNPCGVRYRRGGLVEEYRPKESPSFDVSVHSNMYREVLEIRRNLAHPAPPAAYQPVRARRKRRRSGKGQEPAGAQVGKKRKKTNQPAAVAAVLPVREKSKRIKAKKQHRQQPPQPAAATQPPRAGNDMLLNLDLDLNLPPPPAPALPNAGDGMEVDRHQLPAPPPELPQHITAGNMEMEDQGLPPPPPLAILLHAGGDERMRDEEEPMPPPDPFLFDGASAPMIIDDEPVEVIVIDDD